MPPRWSTRSAAQLGGGREPAPGPRSCSARCDRSRTALWRFNEIARREQTRNQAQASALIPVIVQQVTENVIAQIDFVRVVQQIPVDEIAGAIDIEAIVQRIDLGGVIRESTMSLTMETVDAVRTQGIDPRRLHRAGRRPGAVPQAAA